MVRVLPRAHRVGCCCSTNASIDCRRELTGTTVSGNMINYRGIVHPFLGYG
jgi:hypothetical protein